MHLFAFQSEKADGETVLANFFNSLLTSKKPLRSGSSAAGSSRATSRSEASAEVDKLMKKS